MFVVMRAPFVPDGSFSTCTSSSCPSRTAWRIKRGSTFCASPNSKSLLSSAMSPTYRNAFFSRPMSTNAASMPGSTLRTTPL